MIVAVVGLGPVGLCTAVDICRRRPDVKVIAVDTNEQIVYQLEQGECHFYEPGLDELLQRFVGEGRISFDTFVHTEKLAAAILCIGTPESSEKPNSLDTSALESAANHYRGLCPTIIRSTITDDFCYKFQNKRNLFHVPEFMREGCALRDMQNLEHVSIGCFDCTTDESIVAELFRIDGKPIEICSAYESMMVKLVSNAWHANKIAFVNEVARTAHRIAIQCKCNPKKIMRILTKHTEMTCSPRYMSPGFAYGGSCLQKDTMQLAEYSRGPVMCNINASNRQHVMWVAERIISEMIPSDIRRLVFMGCAFKAKTSDMRENPIADLVSIIKARSPETQIVLADLYAEMSEMAKAYKMPAEYLTLQDLNVLSLSRGEPTAYVITQWDQGFLPFLKAASVDGDVHAFYDLYNTPEEILQSLTTSFHATYCKITG